MMSDGVKKLALLLLQMINYSASMEFSPDKFILTFDPYISAKDPQPGAYTQEDIQRLLTPVASRFRRLISGTKIKERKFNANYSVHLIPLAVASFNVDQNLTDPTSSPLELILKVGFDLNVGWGFNLDRFYTALKLADEANSVFPETVQTLLIRVPDYDDGSADHIKDFLQACRSALKPYGGRYKLAFSTILKKCNIRADKLRPFLPFLDILSFSRPPTPTHFEKGSTAFAAHVEDRVQMCTEFLEDIFNQQDHSLEIQVETWWSDTDNRTGVQNMADFISFWKAMNDYALKSNTTVVMSEAFDTPYKSPEWSHRGWWRRVEHGNSDFELEEKIAVLEALNRNNGTVCCFVSTGALVVIGILPPIVILVICFLLVHQIRKRYKRKLAAGVRYHGVAVAGCGTLPNGLKETEVQFEICPYEGVCEMSLSEVKIEMDSVIGRGMFADVVLGTISRHEVIQQIAVKFLRDGSPKDEFRRMLSELKVLEWVGKHENIVSLVGASTENIQEGKIYLFLELCDHGSLLKHLRELYSQQLERSRSLDFVEEVKRAHGPTFLRWSCEIASGMEFLACRKVVHLDLSAKNVLLAGERRTVKITDFGLSRRLHESADYINTQQEPLPWRWMAPESLRRMIFNERTDVWAYGVTLWEIYSLGEIPYQGISWTIYFCDDLDTGLRLRCPAYNDRNMHALMTACWENVGSDRPTFSEIVAQLSIRVRGSTKKRNT